MQTESNSTSLKPTRAAFVRALPLSIPVEEVIERGREAGVALQPSDVYSARYYMRQASVAQLAHKAKFAEQLVLGGTSAAPSVSQDSPSATESAPTQIASRRRGRRNDAPDSDRAPLEAVVRRSATSTISRTTKRVNAMNSGASLEEQLRTLVLRLGTDRTRAVIDEVTALALRIADR